MEVSKSTALICILSCFIISTAAASFKCTSEHRSCKAIIDYISPNSTTFSSITTLFNVTNFQSFLGVNNLPSSTISDQRVTVNQTIKIPIPCICNNGTGKSDRLPVYTVGPGDSLYHIATVVFSGLVTYPEIQAANGITDANLIEVGQTLWIPLPCSCDEVDGRRVVHYGHVVAAGSSVEKIAEQYYTSQEVLLRLNDLTSFSDLKAGAILDVPLKACTTTVSNNSLDYPLLVPNGTYIFTATDCVMCTCDAAANNWILQCAPSQQKSCPSMQCQGSDNWYLGNTRSSSSCNRTTCSYAGFNNRTIITSIVSLKSTCPERNKGTGAIVGGVTAGAALLFAILAIGFAWRRCKKHRVADLFDEENPEVNLGPLKRISLQELQDATDNFHIRNLIGRGGFGNVYKGFLSDGTFVAVKRMKDDRTPGRELQFLTELEMLSIDLHRNLLYLLGFCMTRTERLLVYPYMANGSVESCLRDRSPGEPPLDWPTRKRIALGSARGLSYLHEQCDPKIIHRDVKAAGVYLDEEFEAVVGNFNLAIRMDSNDTNVTTTVCGTIGYIAPEYLSTGKCNEKTDVFAYGVLLLELISGQRAFDLARLALDDDAMLLDWVKRFLEEKQLEQVVDPELQRNYGDTEVELFIQVALLCTQGLQNHRPKMSDVVKMLEDVGLVEQWNEWLKFEMELVEQQDNVDWIIEPSENLDAIELSGPR